MDKQRIEGIKKLEQKVRVLEGWLATDIPHRLSEHGNRVEDSRKGGFQLEWYPKSVSGLRGWNGSKNNPATVAKYGIPKNTTAHTTYKAISQAIRDRIEGTCKLPSLFARLKEKEKMQYDNGHLSKIQNLNSQLALVKKNHEAIAHEMIALRLENDTLNEDVQVKERQMIGLKLQHKSEIEWRNKLAKQQQHQVMELEGQSHHLRQQLNELMEKTGIYPEEPTPQTNIIQLKQDD